MATLTERIGTIFVRTRERFVVIEEAVRGYDVTAATVDSAAQRVTCAESYHAQDFRHIRRGLMPFDRGIVLLDGRRATTVESSARVRRENANRPIDEGELDTLVFKALWEFLNRHRSWAAAKMGVTDLELTLATVEVVDVLLDGHRLLNPVGFRGMALSVGFRGTFVPRTLAAAFDRFGGWIREFTAAERGSFLAHASCVNAGDYLIDVSDRRTVAFARTDGNLVFVREFEWGAATVIESVAAALSSTPDVAASLMSAVQHGRASERFSRTIDRVLRPDVERLHEYAGMLAGNQRRSSAPVRGSSSRSIPRFFIHFRVPVPRFSTLAVRPPFIGVTADDIYASRGYAIAGNAASAETVAAITYPHAHREYGILNQLLRRRARWLIAQP